MADQNVTFRQRISNFLNFVWNSETKQFLGRTGKSWAGIGVFYVIYYSCLAGFFAAMIAIFYTTIEDKRPKLSGYDSLLKQNPGLGLKPLPDIETTLIRYVRREATSYEDYVKDIEKFLASYKAAGKDVVNCTEDVPRPDEPKACEFDIDALTQNCSEANEYGYADGRPCVLLKLNRIFDWTPEPYESDLPEEMPEDLKNVYDTTQVWVSCEGENPADRDNMGDLSFYPRQGFSMKYFPYRNQKNYTAPLVFVKFNEPVKHVGMMIECKAWAKNIWHDRMDKQGSVHFEVLVD